MLLVGGARDGLDIPDPGCETVTVIVPVILQDGWANPYYDVSEDRATAIFRP